MLILKRPNLAIHNFQIPKLPPSPTGEEPYSHFLDFFLNFIGLSRYCAYIKEIEVAHKMWLAIGPEPDLI